MLSGLLCCAQHAQPQLISILNDILACRTSWGGCRLASMWSSCPRMASSGRPMCWANQTLVGRCVPLILPYDPESLAGGFIACISGFWFAGLCCGTAQKLCLSCHTASDRGQLGIVLKDLGLSNWSSEHTMEFVSISKGTLAIRWSRSQAAVLDKGSWEPLAASEDNCIPLQIVYILDQVRALEREMLKRMEVAGLQLQPQILVVTRLIPEAQGTTCNQRIEAINSTHYARILRVPFRDQTGKVVPHWMSR